MKPTIQYLWFSEKQGWQLTSFHPREDAAIGYKGTSEFVDYTSYQTLLAQADNLIETLSYVKSELVAINNYDETRYKHMTAWQEIDKSQKAFEEFKK